MPDSGGQSLTICRSYELLICLYENNKNDESRENFYKISPFYGQSEVNLNWQLKQFRHVEKVMRNVLDR